MTTPFTMVEEFRTPQIDIDNMLQLLQVFGAKDTEALNMLSLQPSSSSPTLLPQETTSPNQLD